MTENEKKEWAGIITSLDSKTKLLGLIALVAEALFLGALPFLRDQRLLWALLACASILLVTIIGIIWVEVIEASANRPERNRLNPSPLTPRSEFLGEVINSAIQTVCRAVSLPQTPQTAQLRVFIFRKENNQLICSHFWSQDPVTEQVGKLRFDLTSEVAKKVAVVRAAMDDRICRTHVDPLPTKLQGVAGDVADDLTYVLAAPIKNADGSVWGTVDFDTSSSNGRALLSTEVSDSVMFQVARHLSVVFALEHQRRGAIA